MEPLLAFSLIVLQLTAAIQSGAVRGAPPADSSTAWKSERQLPRKLQSEGGAREQLQRQQLDAAGSTRRGAGLLESTNQRPEAAARSETGTRGRHASAEIPTTTSTAFTAVGNNKNRHPQVHAISKSEISTSAQNALPHSESTLDKWCRDHRPQLQIGICSDGR